jgi:hypothetical protein
MEEKKSRRQDKWDEKAGMSAKTYKVNKEIAERFAVACKVRGVSQGGQLTKMMKEFIEQVNEEHPE